METKVIKIDSSVLDKYSVYFDEAADIIKRGGLVAFPTETVYGLGADGKNPEAAKKIYAAKGRPADNPLIAHISDIAMLSIVTADKSSLADRLIKEFWPGPLTLIFKKTEAVPWEASGGLDTIGVRFPLNRIAQRLIERSGTFIVAPSANSSGKPSPTKAAHVRFDLGGKIDMILDGGNSALGLESTIVDVTRDPPVLLRPGSVTRERLESVVGKIVVDKSVRERIGDSDRPISPGQKYTHYSPLAELIIFEGESGKVSEAIIKRARSACKKTGILATEQTKSFYGGFFVISLGDRDHPEEIASNLFAALRSFDSNGIEVILSESFPEEDLGLAIMNRLKKAAGYNIIHIK